MKKYSLETWKKDIKDYDIWEIDYIDEDLDEDNDSSEGEDEVEDELPETFPAPP